MKATTVINTIAAAHNLSVEEVRIEIMTAILAAKDNENFQAIFGKNVIPSLEEFIRDIANMI